MSGFAVDPDVLAVLAAGRRQAAERLGAAAAPDPVAADAFGVIGRLFAGGASAAVEAGAAALAGSRDRLRRAAESLDRAAADYRAVDAAAARLLGEAASGGGAGR
jgi:hypothetical protein